MKQTPLYHHHEQLDARIVDFAGFAMPIQYSGILKEHTAVRETAGLFDVSHMGEFEVRGPDAEKFIQSITVNDVSKLVDGKAQYSMLLNEQAGIIDDIIVYRRKKDDFLIVVNAGNIDNDWHWTFAHREGDIELKNLSAQFGLIALQGPLAEKILQPLTQTPLSSIKRFHFVEASIAGVPVTIACTGYTGEAGYEIFVASEQAGAIWTTLMTAGEQFGMLPCGLAARDTLRLEMAYPLHGHEITPKITPFEANLDWVVKMDKGNFIGHDALLAQRKSGIHKKLVGLKMIDRGIPREGYPIISGGKPVGYVTSGTMSPSLKLGIALAYVPTEQSALGSRFQIDIRGDERVAEVVSTPFYKK